ncbi:peptidoglycan-binding domain-containing protein [Palleronia rufa]|uniref:peptidoglycan-binding domain-containing protein n=1 Tax=Palleronia rufa TaxID=1530186 RepID=UPI00068FD0CA|nr:peptidoglycan-binding domain-containing protein [Palleronia rufa]
MRHLLTAFLLAASAAPALGREAALLVGNDSYDTLDPVAAAGGIGDAADALSDAGVDVTVARNAGRAALLDSLRGLSDGTAEAQAVVLVGRFANFGNESFFLPVEAPGTGPVDGIAAGIPVSAVAELLARRPGRAVLILGAPEEGAFPDVDLPQGVTLMLTDAGGAVRAAREVLARPGAALASAAGDDLRIAGFAPAGLSFLPDAPAAPQPVQATAQPVDIEEDYWQLTRNRDDVAAYRNYLDRYPGGRFATEAQARIDRLTETPETRAARAESALGLNPAGRQDVQRDLSVLGYDTRGIDGIFGSGTRSAIRGWQSREGLDATGYLTADQLARLDQQGAARAAELEAEETRRREETRAEDERLWSSLGDSRSEAQLRRYLDRFPDGAHAQTARAELSALDDARAARGGTAQGERRRWQLTRRENTAQGYRAYLREYPNGRFAEEARAAIAELDRARPQNREAEAAENALGLSPAVRRAVEQRLAALRLDPGAVDGEFDQATRAALRRYQQSAGIPDTGYVNQITAVRLLADSLRDVLQ